VDFFLFPRLKSIMKSESFGDVAAIQERVTAVLRSIPKEAFADRFQKLYERYQQCVVKDGDYFEGVVNLGIGEVTEVKPTLPKSLGSVKPVLTGAKYEYLLTIYRFTMRSR
jgi:hypothetical protein